MRSLTVSAFAALLGLAACNLLVGNESGTAVLREDGGGPVLLSSSSSGSTAPFDASSSSSSSSGDAAPDAAAVTCACGANGDVCALCPLESVQLEPALFDPEPLGADLSALAATTTALYGARHEGSEILRYPRVGDTIATDAGVGSASMSTQMQSATPAVGSNALQPFYYSLLFGRGSVWFSYCEDSIVEECVSPSLLGQPVEMVSTQKGVLILVYLATSGFNFHWLDGDAVRQLSWFYAPPDTAIPITAHGDNAYWYVPSFQGSNTRMIHGRVLGAQDTVTHPLAIDEPEISRLAANDEELFVSPCADGLICAYALPLVTSAVPRIVLPKDGNAELTTLDADQNALYFTLRDVGARCEVTHCTPESLSAEDAGELRALTHTAQYTYLQVGARTLRTRRSPLRPAQ